MYLIYYVFIVVRMRHEVARYVSDGDDSLHSSPALSHGLRSSQAVWVHAGFLLFLVSPELPTRALSAFRFNDEAITWV